MTKAEILAVVVRAVARVLPDAPAERVTLAATMKDLGADSVDRSDILATVKEELELTVSVADLGRTENIGALVDLVFALVAKR
jgi:polyketide biosynthesis acyl carrier protein